MSFAISWHLLTFLDISILTVSLWGYCGRIETPDAETVDEYVDNDVDVDDVDDDEEGAAAYFFWSETAMVIPTVNYKSVEDKPFYSISQQFSVNPK